MPQTRKRQPLTLAELDRLGDRWQALCQIAPEAKRRITFEGYVRHTWPERLELEAELLGSRVLLTPEERRADAVWIAAALALCAALAVALLVYAIAEAGGAP